MCCEVDQDRLRRVHIHALREIDGFFNDVACGERVCGLEALSSPCEVREIICVLDFQPPRDDVLPRERSCFSLKVERDAHGGTRAPASGAMEPGAEVDERDACEGAVLECGVARDVRMGDVQLDDACSARAANEAVDDEATIVSREKIG